MKSSFSRSFFPAVIILLMTLSVVGVIFQVIARNVVEEQGFERMESQAETVARLVSVYAQDDTVQDEMFFINLKVATESTDIDTVICNKSGMLILCADAPMGCDHQGLYIRESYKVP